jgi:hypothetical protein
MEGDGMGESAGPGERRRRSLMQKVSRPLRGRKADSGAADTGSVRKSGMRESPGLSREKAGASFNQERCQRRRKDENR